MKKVLPVPIHKIQNGKRYPLTSNQLDIWFDQVLNPDIPLYNIGGYACIDGPLEVKRFERAVNCAVARHDALRLVLEPPAEDGLPRQRFTDPKKRPLPFYDFSQEKVPHENALAWMQEQMQVPFFLYGHLLYQFALLRISPARHYCFNKYHHLVADGWSISLFDHSGAEAYNASDASGRDPCPKIHSYIDFIEADNAYLNSKRFSKDEAYWRQKYRQLPEPLVLPRHAGKKSGEIIPGRRRTFYLRRSFYDRLTDYAAGRKISVFHIIVAALYCYFTRIAQQDEFVIGLPILNRSGAGFKKTVGLFAGVIAARFCFGTDLGMDELLRKIGAGLRRDYRRQRYPVGALNRHLDLHRMGRRQIFDVNLSYEKHDYAVHFGDAKAVSTALPNQHSREPLSIYIREFHAAEDVAVDFDYNVDFFTEEEMKGLEERFVWILEGILACANRPVKTFPILPERERYRVVTQFNRTDANYPQDQTLVDLFQAQAAGRPEAIALVFEDETMTYGQLNARANRLAHYLIGKGVGPDRRVAVAVTRSLELVVGLLAILKAGGAYVPLDPAYPAQRLATMIEDSAPALLLTQSRLKERWGPPSGQMPVIDLDGDSELWQRCPVTNPDPAALGLSACHLAYVIYTSGSTGWPKGVALTHRNVFNFICWASDAFSPAELKQTLFSTSLNFDLSVFECFVPLSTGGTVIGVSNAVALINKAMDSTLINTVPSAIKALVDAHAVSETTHTVNLAGEPLRQELVERLFNTTQVKTVCNLYGPSETTTYSTWVRMARIKGFAAHIGRPIANTRIYLLDAHHQPLPVGVPGELYIGGAGVARGYLNRPELTADCFLPDPYAPSGEPDARMYKTGDRARWRSDGNLEFLGRMDHQVKLRGFRIEPGEIESALREHARVEEAAVILTGKADNPRLAGFVTAANSKDPSPDPAATASILREHLNGKLPAFMVPATITLVASMPRTPNGKLDRRALAGLETLAPAEAFVAPRCDAERRLTAVWRNVLKREDIGVGDNFFELGGDSILSIQVVSGAREQGLEITPRELFEHQRIEALARVARRIRTPAGEQGPVSGPVLLTPIQKHFLDDHALTPHHFNQALLLEIPAETEAPALRRALNALVEHHDALRMRYDRQAGCWRQYQLAADHQLPFEVQDLSRLPAKEQAGHLEKSADACQAGLNIVDGPLMRLVLFRLKGGLRFFWCIHHLVIDGVSWRILIDDLRAAYGQILAGRPVRLPSKTTSFKAWAEALTAYGQSEAVASQLAYWQAIPEIRLPAEKGPAGPARAGPVDVVLDREKTASLLGPVQRAYRTRINDVLLTALALTLRQWTGQSQMVIDLESHGRHTHLIPHTDLTRTVGWFTSIYPVHLVLPPGDRPAEALKAVKEQLRAVPGEGLGYGLVRCPAGRRLPRGQVLFNYLGQFDPAGEADGFGLASEGTGRSRGEGIIRRHRQEINARVVSGRLHLAWGYHDGRDRRETMARLAQSYIGNLETLIGHCLEPAARGYTPSDFAGADVSQAELDRLAATQADPIEDIYPLSPMQQGMVFHTLYAPGDGTYFEQTHFRLHVVPGRFKAAWQKLVEHHPVLRTGLWREKSLQIVYRKVRLPWREHDWRALAPERQARRLQALLARERRKGFDLSQAPLMRFDLIRLDEKRYCFIWHRHHALLDGWSGPLLFADLVRIYQALGAGRDPELEPAGSYGAYIRWLIARDGKAAAGYWQKTLEGIVLPTPVGVLDRPGDSARPAQSEFGLSACMTRTLFQFSRRHRVTVNTVIQGAWALLLSRYSGEPSVVFGVTISGRHVPLQGVDRVAGLLINTIPLAVTIGDEPAVPWLRRIQRRHQQDQDHGLLPLYEMKALGRLSGNRELFETLLVFENYPMGDALAKAPDLCVEGLTALAQTNYALTLAVIPGQRSLAFRLSYDAFRLHEAAVTRLWGHLERLLQAMLATPGQAVRTLPLLTDAEKQQLRTWNDTRAAVATDQTLVDLFQAQAAERPEAIALVFDAETMTYGQLNARANRLAHYLIGKGVGPDRRVAIGVARSLEMVVGLLAILKAGGAYVPLHPQFPAERMACMIDDSAPVVLITQTWMNDLRVNLPHSLPVIELDRDPQAWHRRCPRNPGRKTVGLRPDHLAYVIYTSGSTGKPKGVMVPHGGVVNYLEWAVHACAPVKDSVVSSAMAFDLAVTGLWPPLVCGGCVTLVKEGDELDGLEKRMTPPQTAGIVKITPSHLEAVGQRIQAKAAGCGAELFVIGGEVLSPSILRMWRQIHPSGRFMNHYGPTEAIVGCVAHEVTPATGQADHIPIGRPIANKRIYILDAGDRRVPMGVPGELHIGGIGLARGYLNRPDLTAERFLPDPYAPSGEPHARLYKTGDRARWRPDGNLEFLGRMDQQVKLRGFRIEPGEIEFALREHALVKEAAVILTKKEADPRLAGFVTAAERKSPFPDSAATARILREHLKSKLPAYMVPASITLVRTMPRTPNGKLDRRALAGLEKLPVSPAGPLASSTEAILAALWAELLNQASVAKDADFFDMGGHSLLATRLVSRIREQFGVELPIRAVFETPVLGDMARRIRAADASRMPATIVPLAEGTPVPLSFAQQRLWFLDRMQDGSAVYNMPGAFALKGPLDIQALCRAFVFLIERHTSLRMRFPQVKGRAVVKLLDTYDPLTLRDLRSLPAGAREETVRRLMARDAAGPFDLSKGPLLRATLLVLGKERHVLLVNMHHIVSDGWSMGVFVAELSRAYDAFLRGDDPGLAPLAIDYPDYAGWQRGWLKGPVLARQLAYWERQLKAAPALLELPADHPRPAVQTYRGAHHRQRLPKALTGKLRSFSAACGATLFMTLLAAFKVLLFRLSGQADICVGSPVANRIQHSIEGLIGFFVNTLVLRTHMQPEGFGDLLQRVRQTCLEAYAHQDIPFEYLVEQLNPRRAMSHSPLFQVMFVLQNAPFEAPRLTGLDVRPLGGQVPTAKFDLTLSVDEVEDALDCLWEYSTDLFQPERIERMGAQFNVLLEGIVSAPGQALSTLPLLTAAEEKQLRTWNHTRAAVPTDQTVVDLFQAQAAGRPEAIALVCEAETLTYGQLNASANRLAHYLIGKGIGPDRRVAIGVTRSLEMVVGLLAILKAGGAYVPLDPDYPKERLTFMLEDSAPMALLTQSRLRDRWGVPAGPMPVIELDRDTGLWQTCSSANPDLRALGLTSHHPAYVIYTSGSTGKPKGVMVDHRNVINFLTGMRRKPGLTSRDTLLAVTTLSFDIHVLEIYLPLIAGAGCMIATREVAANGEQLSELMAGSKATAMQATPSTWRILIASGWTGAQNLKVLCGGEALPIDLAAKLKKRVHDLWNLFGPTETTVWSTCFQINEVEKSIPIGKPIVNTRIYVLDRHMQLVPVGVVGELYIGGAGVARGYLNRPDLTAERFLPDPYAPSGEPEARLYKTGDRARWRPDGNLEFLGRLDHQVKLRGLRIEPGEIESILKAHALVKEAAVVPTGKGDNPRLAGFVTAADQKERSPDPAATARILREHLKGKLPAYMVPASITLVATMPLAPNGKLDRRALAGLEKLPVSAAGPLASPTEAILAALWAELLNQASVARDADFFDLGGHSLLATRLVSRIREQFGVELPLRAVFETPVLGDMARQIRAADASRMPATIMPLAEGTPVPLSFAQQRLWFLDRMQGGSAVYNLPGAFALQGPLDIQALCRAFVFLIERHAGLRMRFPQVKGRAVVKLLDTYDPLTLRDLRCLPAGAREEKVRRLTARDAAGPFDLSKGPLLRATLLVLEKERHVLLVNMHHIISDGWSMGVFVAELSRAYDAFLRGKDPDLAPLAIDYPDYAGWQRGWLKGPVLARQLAYWKTQLEAAPALLELPADHPRPAVQTYRGAHRRQRLPKALTGKLRSFSAACGATLFMTLLAAFKVLLFRLSGQTDICVGSPVANRTQRRIEGLIGFFVNTLVLRTRIQQEGFGDLLQRVRQTCLEAYAHQDIAFEYLVEQLNPRRDTSHSPLFQVMFVLQNAPFEAPRLADLDVRPLGGELPTAKFDLTLIVAEAEDELDCLWEYSTDLFDAASIDRMIGHFHTLLQGIVADPQKKISDLPLLTAAEKKQLRTWNDTRAAVATDQTLVDLFQAQAAECPEAIALVFDAETMTYGQLNARANRLAHDLIGKGVGPDRRVAIGVARSLELVVGLLAILKAGGAYVPLHPQFPAERIACMIEESAPVVLITQTWMKDLRVNLPRSLPVIELDRDPQARHRRCSRNPGRKTVGLRPDHLAYVIYTSGSTGKPKGVMVPHGGVVNYLKWAVHACAPVKDSVVSSAMAFDLAVTGLWPPLVCGGCVTLVKEGDELDGLEKRMTPPQTAGIVKITPSHLEAVGQRIQAKAAGCGAELFVIGGEVLSPSILRMWRQIHPSGRFMNHYGPTEAIVGCVAHEVTPATGQADHIPIGRPIANKRIYILDAGGRRVPMGVPGELHIGGIGLARGYLNRPDLTAERFLPDPYAPSGEPHARLYKTGDRARWRPDGNLEFMGRMDQQVKLRGFRIEPGEIEFALREHALVKEAAVILTKKEADPRLAGFVTPAERKSPFPDSAATARILREHLKGKLPAYMVPASITLVRTMPRTPDGKLDRRALAGLEKLPVSPAGPLASSTEAILAALWAELLNQASVARDADFFDLGGHSLLATRLVSRIREQFGVELPLRAVFETPVLGDMARQIRAADASRMPVTIVPLAEGTPLPLSFAQQRLWFIDRMQDGSAVYNRPEAFALTGPLDIQALSKAFVFLIERHASLRMRFPQVKGRAVVKLLDTYDPLVLSDLRSLPAGAREEKVRRLAAGDAASPFDLSKGPLLRATLWVLGKERHVLLVNLHHIVSDGWSMGVFVAELSRAYDAFLRGADPGLAPLAIDYPDYAGWQRGWLKGPVLARQLAYWKTQLKAAPALLELPADHPRPAVQTYRGAHHRRRIAKALTGRLRSLSAAHGATLFMTLLAAFKVLLFRLSGQTDICVGSPVANRTHHQLEGLIGFFVNTLVLRTHMQPEGFGDLLQRVRQTCLEAHAHQDIAFEYLVEQLNPRRAMSHSPLFQVMFVLQNAPFEAPRLTGLDVRPLGGEFPTAKFDLTLIVAEAEDELDCLWEYSTDLFDAASIDRMTGHFHILLEGIVADPQKRVSDLPLLTDAEKKQLQTWNDTRAAFATDQTLVDLFQAQAAGRPEAIALVFEDQTMTYGQLNARANRLAHYLIGQGVGPDRRVAVAVTRRLELVVGLLAVLKAGGAYVPLDPDYPAQRLAAMIADSAPALLLTQSRLKERWNTLAGPMPVIDLDGDSERWQRCPAANPDPAALGLSACHLAYVIYTSGSTGRPKGVALTHRNVFNFICWAADAFSPAELKQTLFSTSLNFDLSVFECFVPICTGGTVLGVPNAVALINQAMDSTLINTVPSAIKALVDAHAVSETTRTVNLAGEPLPQELVERLFNNTQVETVCNLYGPSETTTYSTWVRMARIKGFAAHIGRPIANTRIYLLDAHRRPLPVGVPGELYIGGAGVARGYLNRPGLTAECFLPDPYAPSDEPDARMYRTGDRARRRPDGNLEFLGRMDHQVKLRGFRIEPGEIESALREHALVKEAAVILTEKDDNPRLAGYVTVADQNEASPDTAALPSILREQLKGKLPAYMVPASITLIRAMPRTPNGKLDRRALAGLEKLPASPAGLLASPTEAILAALWAELLNQAGVARDAHFFDLGGHSLLATRLVSRIREQFGVELPLRAVFETPVLGDMARQIRAADACRMPAAIVPLAEGASVPLSFAQQRLWFIDRMQGGSAVYNMPGAFALKGPLDIQALCRAFVLLIERHASLRMRFPQVKGRAVVELLDPYDPLALSDLRSLPAGAREEKVRRLAAQDAAGPFDLAKGPLLRATLLVLGKERHVLLVNLHHIVSDGWSMGVFVAELARAYDAFLRGDDPGLAPLTIDYPDYAGWQRGWLKGPLLARQLAYWKTRLKDAPALLELPADHPRPAVQTYRGARRRQRIAKALTGKLRSLSAAHGATLFMTLLAAFKVLLFRLSGQTDIVVGSPVANRTQRQIEGLIGFFVNTLVLRTQIQQESFGDLLQRVRQTCLEAYAHQDIAFEYLVEQLNPRRAMSHGPLFQVMFALQNAPFEAPRLAGLDVRPLGGEFATAKFDLTLIVNEAEDELDCLWEYSTDLFQPERIERMGAQFGVLLEGIVSAPGQALSTLPLLTAAEKKQLRTWNHTRAAVPADQTVVDLFQAQAAERPEAIALVFEAESMTYGQLNARANRLAHYLIGKGVGPDRRVAVSVTRSLEMVVGLLAILKAGGAYVPLDPEYPKARLAFMLEDSAVKVLLTQSALVERVPAHRARTVCLDREREKIDTCPQDNPARSAGAGDLAYVIYTSGSTGRPKGVAMGHRPLLNLILWQLNATAVTGHAKTLQFASVSFDVSFQEMFSTWGGGGTLVVIDDACRKDAGAMLHYINTMGIERLFLPFVALQQLAIASTSVQTTSVREIITAGEQLRITPEISAMFAKFKDCVLHNHYGPTESHVATAFTLPDKVTHWPGLPPIGEPISNTRIYLLDNQMHPVPIGVPGELCIAGAGLARGYLNRPGLTAERFLPDPYAPSDEPAARLYKTGDRARRRSDGTLEFLGRMDHQVKLRGFRIEPGEIESILREHALVKEAAVILTEKDDNPRLAGFVTVEDQKEPSPDPAAIASILREQLKDKLPAYMVPASITLVAGMPRTPNGKLDRMALARLEWRRPSLGYLPPRDRIELELVQIWQDVLQRRPIGCRDDFFDLGGHSLLALQLMDRMQTRFKRRIPLKFLFLNPTVEQMVLGLNAKEHPRPGKALVPLQFNGGENPFFCLPGAGGTAFYLHALASHLGPGQPFYSLQPPGLDGEQAPFNTVEALAAAYLKDIKAQFPQGGYRLGGHSFGGTVSFEMARQMEAQDDRVDLLVIFDAPSPDDSHNAMDAPPDETGYLMNILKVHEAWHGGSLEIEIQDLEALPDHDARLDHVAGRLRESGMGLHTDISPEQLKRLLNIYRANAEAIAGYGFRNRIRAPILLLQAEEVSPEQGAGRRLSSPDWGWGRFTRGDVFVERVPGSHVTMLKPPHVDVLARKLAHYLIP